MKQHKIAWTDDVWNPVTGCAKVSAGCKNCYAETMAKRFWQGRAFTDVQCHEDRLEIPLHWRKPRRVFVNSMSDLFHPAVPDEFIDRVFAVMALCSQHTFQVLTKRPERMAEYLADCFIPGVTQGPIRPGEFDTRQEDRNLTHDRIYNIAEHAGLAPFRVRASWPLHNCWLGTSVEDQASADARIPDLLRCPAAVRFVSYEPALEGVDFRRWLWRPMANDELPGWALNDGITSGERPSGVLHQIIFGGESGPGARPCDIAWARSVRDQCQAAGVAFFMKQAGSRACDGDLRHRDAVDWCRDGSGYYSTSDSYWLESGRWMKLRDSKGSDPEEWPEGLRVREWPKGVAA